MGAPPKEGALAGSGLIVVNPPFPLESELRTLLPPLVRLLAPAGGSRIDWLAKE
jgi:23S rRNA (adenine2030-N6)-methyltransferase